MVVPVRSVGEVYSRKLDGVGVKWPLYPPGVVMACFRAEVEALCRFIKFFGFKTVFEIGTFLGHTTRALAENVGGDGVVYSLDNGSWVDDFGSLVKGNERVKLIRADSFEFDFSPFYGKVGLVFIDGDHSYEVVSHDTLEALRMVVPGGVIAWHDYHHEEGVERFVNEFAASRDVYCLRGTYLAFWRKDESFQE